MLKDVYSELQKMLEFLKGTNKNLNIWMKSSNMKNLRQMIRPSH